ncbi:MAG: lamin tail domain-containing protein, partial [Methanomassiliicoccaceae archaeon]|nr:lamin tail domain-containing protein [Methanomassiliicoccaceae archaeon]
TYLHTSSDDDYDLTSYERADAAELIAFRDGYMEIDLGAVMSQTLIGLIDSILISWMDYLMLTKILDIIEGITDALKNAYDWLRNLFGKGDAETAQGYISGTMSKLGIPESEYRYLLNGMIGMVDLPSVELDMSYAGNGSIKIPASRVVFGYPDVDVLKWSGWNGFMSKYRSEHNEIRETLIGMMKSVANGLASTYGMGKVRIGCDPYDTDGFLETMTSAIYEALEMNRTHAEDLMESTIRSEKIIDPLYASIYRQMETGMDSLFKISELENNIRVAIKDNINGYLKDRYGVPLDPSAVDSAVGEMMNSYEVVRVISDYKEYAGQRMEMFGNVLNNIEKNNRSIFTDLIVILVRFGADILGLYPLLEAKMTALVREMAAYAAANPMDGVSELPGTDSFILDDGKGTILKENVSLDLDYDLDIKITPPTGTNDGTHFVGFGEYHEAAYSCTFRVFVTADVRYQATSTSPLLEMLGSYDAAVSGVSHSEFDLPITVISAWELTGVDYEPSNTIVADVAQIIFWLLEPIIGPLLELVKIAKNVINHLMNALMRVAEYVAEILMKLFDVLSGPLSWLADKMTGLIEMITDGIISTLLIEMNKQTLTLNIHGLIIEFTSDILNALKNNIKIKIKATLPIFGVLLSVWLDIKKNGSSKAVITCGFSVVSGTWSIYADIDPMMKTRKSIVEMDATIRGIDIHASMPLVVQYEDLEFRLSDIPGVGEVLSNIPLPVPGLKGSLDAGFELKYNSPFVYGLVINEFELNPPGPDADNEWVELYNSTLSTVDLEGYRLVPFSHPSKEYIIHDFVLHPGQRIVITFPGQFLNNAAEAVILYDADDNEIDRTPLKSDSKNDDLTWQRETDASAKWVFKKATKGTDNGGKMMGGNPVRALIMECVMNAARTAFAEFGLKIIGPDGVADFLKRVIELTIRNAIDMIASCVVSASVFIEIAVNDYTGSIHSGLRFSLFLDGDFVRDGLNWIVGQIKGMMNNMDNPTGMAPRQIISDDVYIQTMVFFQVTAPKVLGPLSDDVHVTAGIVVSCNLTAVSNLLGRGGGTWRVNAGIVLEDYPSIMVPAMFKVDLGKKTDLWLFKMTFERSRS